MTATHSRFIVSINLILSSVNFTTNNPRLYADYIILCQWQGRGLLAQFFAGYYYFFFFK